VLLGMMVAGWFAGAENGILYIRAEYPDSVTIINEAIEDLARSRIARAKHSGHRLSTSC
jgi:NADH:ubiquinone oxidoreductase subunit F (NADH-binding)